MHAALIPGQGGFHMSRTARDVIIVSSVAILVFFLNLGGPTLWDEDEPRNAGCAAEMLQRGDWVVPYFNGSIRTHKPVLVYWFMMSAYTVFGVSEFSARFWSAVLGTGTVIATWYIGTQVFSKRVGLLAGIILATSVIFGIASRAATPDSVLVFFSTAALSVYVWSTRNAWSNASAAPEDWYPQNLPALALIYALMGFGVLDKGPVGLVLPTAVLGMFLLLQWMPKDLRPAENTRLRLPRLLMMAFAPLHFLKTCLRMRPLIAIAAALAVALPWYIWVTIRTDGEWTYGFFVTHNVGRAMQPMENHGGIPLVYYIVTLMLGFFPWSSFFGPMLIDLTRDMPRNERWQAGRTFALCWVGVYVVLFSMARTKLPSYITPCYPGLALLMATFVDRLASGEERVRAYWPLMSWLVLIATGVGFLIAVPIAADQFLPGGEWLGMIGLIPLVGGIACWRFWSRLNRKLMLRSMLITSVAFAVTLMGIVTKEVSKHQQIEALFAKARELSDDPQVATYSAFRSSWVFYAGHPVHHYKSAAYNEASEFLAGNNDHFVITTKQRMEKLEAASPILAEVPWFLRDETLVLVRGQETGANVRPRRIAFQTD